MNIGSDVEKLKEIIIELKRNKILKERKKPQGKRKKCGNNGERY